MEWITFEERTFKGAQSLEGFRIEIREPDGPRIRARIDRDAHDFQSSVVVEAWMEAGWREILTRPITETRVAAFSYVSRGEAWKLAMLDDLAALIATGIRFVQGDK